MAWLSPAATSDSQMYASAKWWSNQPNPDELQWIKTDHGYTIGSRRKHTTDMNSIQQDHSQQHYVTSDLAHENSLEALQQRGLSADQIIYMRWQAEQDRISKSKYLDYTNTMQLTDSKRALSQPGPETVSGSGSVSMMARPAFAKPSTPMVYDDQQTNAGSPWYDSTLSKRHQQINQIQYARKFQSDHHLSNSLLYGGDR